MANQQQQTDRRRNAGSEIQATSLKEFSLVWSGPPEGKCFKAIWGQGSVRGRRWHKPTGTAHWIGGIPAAERAQIRRSRCIEEAALPGQQQGTYLASSRSR